MLPIFGTAQEPTSRKNFEDEKISLRKRGIQKNSMSKKRTRTTQLTTQGIKQFDLIVSNTE